MFKFLGNVYYYCVFSQHVGFISQRHQFFEMEKNPFDLCNYTATNGNETREYSSTSFLRHSFRRPLPVRGQIIL